MVVELSPHPLARLCAGEPVELEPGLHVIPRSVYDCIPAFSGTVLNKWLSFESVPSEFADWLETRWSGEPISEAKLLGSALDCMLLEPEHFAEKFAVVPDDAPPRPNSRTRQAKNPLPSSLAAMAYWDEFAERNAGKQILSAAQCTNCLEMKLSLSKAPCAQGVFEYCQKVALVGELFGLPAKAEIDLWNPDIKHIIDLKTALNVSSGAFARAIIDLNYLEQATFYLLLAQACGFEEKNTFTWVTVKNQRPWTVKAQSFEPFLDSDHFDLFRAAERRLARAAHSLKQRLEMNDFSNSQDWERVLFPQWALRQAKLENLSIAAA